eukprot:2643727-Rhodomonas_salina.1
MPVPPDLRTICIPPKHLFHSPDGQTAYHTKVSCKKSRLSGRRMTQEVANAARHTWKSKLQRRRTIRNTSSKLRVRRVQGFRSAGPLASEPRHTVIADIQQSRTECATSADASSEEQEYRAGRNFK